MRADVMERQPQLAGRPAVVGNHVNQFRPRRPFRLAERVQPLRPIVAVGLQIALVEDHDDRLVGLDRRAKELLHRGVVVFLLRQHGHQHVGRLANGPGPLPVDRRVGIDVGRVEQAAAAAARSRQPPEQAILRRIAQRIVGRLPGAQLRSPRRAAPMPPGRPKPGGTRQTGCFVPAASGLAALAISPAR